MVKKTGGGEKAKEDQGFRRTVNFTRLLAEKIAAFRSDPEWGKMGMSAQVRYLLSHVLLAGSMRSPKDLINRLFAHMTTCEYDLTLRRFNALRKGACPSDYEVTELAKHIAFSEFDIYILREKAFTQSEIDLANTVANLIPLVCQNLDKEIEISLKRLGQLHRGVCPTDTEIRLIAEVLQISALEIGAMRSRQFSAEQISAANLSDEQPPPPIAAPTISFRANEEDVRDALALLAKISKGEKITQGDCAIANSAMQELGLESSGDGLTAAVNRLNLMENGNHQVAEKS